MIWKINNRLTTKTKRAKSMIFIALCTRHIMNSSGTKKVIGDLNFVGSCRGFHSGFHHTSMCILLCSITIFLHETLSLFIETFTVNYEPRGNDVLNTVRLSWSIYFVLCVSSEHCWQMFFSFDFDYKGLLQIERSRFNKIAFRIDYKTVRCRQTFTCVSLSWWNLHSTIMYTKIVPDLIQCYIRKMFTAWKYYWFLFHRFFKTKKHQPKAFFCNFVLVKFPSFLFHWTHITDLNWKVFVKHFQFWFVVFM